MFPNPFNYIANKISSIDITPGFNAPSLPNIFGLSPSYGSSQTSNPNVTTSKPKPTPSQSSSGYDAYTKAIKDLLASNKALLQQTYAPSLNLSAIQAQARKQAAIHTNPFYTKRLNEFLQEQAFYKQVQQQQATTDIQNLEDQLNQTLEQNQITGERTTQDVAKNIADVAEAEDIFQTDTGTAFEQARLQEAKQLAASGLSGGLAAQQEEATRTASTTAEKRQTREFTKAKQEQQLFKARTFEDLARSGKLAKEGRAKGEKQVNFDLNNFIKKQSFELRSKKVDLEIARQEALDKAAQKFGTQAVNRFIQSIANPAQRQAAVQAYGGLTF